jgi:hypothetical protein
VLRFWEQRKHADRRALSEQIASRETLESCHVPWPILENRRYFPFFYGEGDPAVYLDM